MAAEFNIKDKKNIYFISVTVICIAIVYLFYDFLLVPFENEKARLIAEQKANQIELDKINARKHEVPKLEEELEKAEREFERLKEMFPEEENVPIRLQDVYAVVRASGVTIQNFRPAGNEEKEYFVENKYFFNINAGYHMLGYLFAEIANFNYPTTIENLRLSRFGNINQELKKFENNGWEPITMQVSFDLTTFTSRKK